MAEPTQIQDIVLLLIAERSDLKTISAMMQTSKHVHDLLANYQHSIAKNLLGMLGGDSFNRLLTSHADERLESRRVIPIHNSLTSVREVLRRQRRMHYLVNNCGMFKSPSPTNRGMPQRAVEKLRLGIRDALRITERLADMAADPSLYTSKDCGDETQNNVNSKNNNDTTNKKQDAEGPVAVGYADAVADGHGLFAHNDDEIAAYHAEKAKQQAQKMALRNAQLHAVHQLPMRELAWLLTLGYAADSTYRRWMDVELQRDPEMGDYMAHGFTELVVRGGTFLPWAFVQGRGVLAASLSVAVWEAAQEARAFVLGVPVDGGSAPVGLRCRAGSVMATRLRLAAEAEAAAAGDVLILPPGVEEGEYFAHEASLETLRIVRKEIGWEGWTGYYHQVRWI